MILEFMLIIISLMFGVIIGKWTDVYFRIKMLRQITKKDYHLAEIVSKDKKTKIQKVFLPDNSVIWNGLDSYTVEADRIYRTDKPHDMFFLKRDKLTWKEGIPILTLDEDTFRPIDYAWAEKSAVASSEIGSLMKSWVVNQSSKAIVIAFNDMKNSQKATFITLAISLLTLLCCGVLYMQLSDMTKQIGFDKAEVEQIKTQTNYLYEYIIPGGIRHQHSQQTQPTNSTINQTNNSTMVVG